jgi:hypothetical protein
MTKTKADVNQVDFEGVPTGLFEGVERGSSQASKHRGEALACSA